MYKYTSSFEIILKLRDFPRSALVKLESRQHIESSPLIIYCHMHLCSHIYIYSHCHMHLGRQGKRHREGEGEGERCCNT